jgi:hypothetical protein
MTKLPKLIHSAVIGLFLLSLVGSLWFLASCGIASLSHLQPFASFHNTGCAPPMGGQHIQLWRDVLMTFVVASAVIGTAVIGWAFVRQRLHPERQPLIRRLIYSTAFAERSPNIKRWDPLRDAMAHGTIQRGARSQ